MNSELGAMLFNISHPDGEHVRRVVVFASIENAVHRLEHAFLEQKPDGDLGRICIEELSKIIRAKLEHDRALGVRG